MNTEFQNKYYTTNLKLGQTTQSLTNISDRLKLTMRVDKYQVPQIKQFAEVLESQIASLVEYRQNLITHIGAGDWKEGSKHYQSLMDSMDKISTSTTAIQNNIPKLEDMVRTLELGAGLREQGVI